MNRTRSDSRYLELESSTHCNGHEAERLSICLKTNTSRTTESPSFFLSLPPGPTSLPPNVPLFSLPIVALITRIIFSCFASGTPRDKSNAFHSVLRNISEDLLMYISR